MSSGVHTLHTVPVIPVPGRVSTRSGSFNPDAGTTIVAPEPLQGMADFLQRVLHDESGLSLKTAVHGERNVIRLSVDTAPVDGSYAGDAADSPQLGDEGYELVVSPWSADIKAKAAVGVFRGIQTLRQLIPPAAPAVSESSSKTPPQAGEQPGGSAWRGWSGIPCMEIRDNPRFPWRGFMLDVARHFYGVDTVKQILDAMALLKMNILHLHLCDDQGWRLQTDNYPRLIEVGSSRPESQTGGFLSKKTDGTPHSGYFTKDDIRDIIAYASERFITVVPEIEMPGHCTAALAAYPDLGCTGGPYTVATSSGIKKDIYCAGREAVFTFLQDVLDEVAELFPSPFIHIGGDEAPKNRWKTCPDCQRRIKEEGLRDTEELQEYFIRRMVDHIERQGRFAVGWNEILSENLTPTAVGQYWLRGKKQVLQHLRRGGKIIGSHFFHSYLDYNHGVLPLSKVYTYNPVPRGLEPQVRENVLGIEAPLWTESAATLRHVHAFVFPRLAAVAGNAWTPVDKGRDFGEFMSRLPAFLERLRCLGIDHAPITAAQPGLLKRLSMWPKIHRQTSELP